MIASHAAALLPSRRTIGVGHSAGIGWRVTLQPSSTPASATVDADLEVVRKELVAKLADAELMAKVHRAVEAIACVPHGSLIARELVADAVDDTYRGKLPWDPKGSVHQHLVDEARRQFQRSERKRRNHISLEALGDQDTRLVDRSDEPEPANDATVKREQLARARAILVARGELGALQLLTLNQLGVTQRLHVARLGLSGWEYRAAHDRLQEVLASVATPPAPETEHPPEQGVFRAVPSDGVITELTGGHRLGPKRADAGTSRDAAGGLGARIAASRRRSRKR